MQSEILLKALLDDQVNAARSEVEFLFPMGYTVNEAAAEFMVDYCLERDIQMDEVSDLIAYLDNYEQAKLLVFWSEDDDEMKKIVKTALDQGLEVRDLCDALTRLGALPDYKEPQMAVEEDTLYTRDDLSAMEEEEIVAVAESYSIDHASIPDWDTVMDLILQAQDESMTETKAIEADPETMVAVAGADAETAGAGEVLPTLKELSEMERQGLADLVETNELVPMMWDKTDKAWVPMQRPRVPALIRAIWIAIDGPFSGDGNPDDPNNEPIEREDAEVAVATETPTREDDESPSGMVEAVSLEVDLNPVLEAVEDLKNFVDNRYGHLLAAITAQSQLIGTLGRSMDNLTAEIKASKPEAVPGQIVPAKAVGAIKKGLRRPPG